MMLIVDARGHVQCLYGEMIDLASLGALHIHRSSHVEPDAQGKWYADLAPVGGPLLGPFDHRSQALLAEERWLLENWLTTKSPT